MPRAKSRPTRTAGGNVERRAQTAAPGKRVRTGHQEAVPHVATWHPELANYLMSPGELVPGRAIYNKTTNMHCSAGHFATTRDGKRLFLLTAGHCGKKGERFAYRDSSHQWIDFGEVVERAFSGEGTYGSATGYDIAIIEVDNPRARWNSQPPITGKVVGSADLGYVAANGMGLCRIGSTDGLSCGNYVGQMDGGFFEYGNQERPGDSGGAIYAVNSSGSLYAVGVASYSERNAPVSSDNYAGGMEIFSTLHRFGLLVL